MRRVKNQVVIGSIFAVVSCVFFYFMATPTLPESLIYLIQHQHKIKGRHLNIIDYQTYTLSDAQEIECVQLRMALNGARVCLHPTDKDIHVSGMLRSVGVWEPHIVTAVTNELFKCPDCQFIDVGANIGVYTLTVASMGRRVVSVEPVRANLMRLVMGITLNQMTDNVITIRNAVSDVYEKVRFWQPLQNAGGTMVSNQKNVIFDKTELRKIDDVIPTVKLDDLLQVIDFRKAIMKIDIEGLEPKAFRAASQLFEAVDIKFVFMEWSKKGNSSHELIQPMLDFFMDRGYIPYDVNNMFVPLFVTPRLSIVKRMVHAAKTGHLARDVKLNFEMTRFWPFDIVWVKS